MTKNIIYICRSLARSRASACIVILTLGLGLGATSAVLIFANTLLFHPLPYANSDRVVNLWSSKTGGPEPIMTVSPAEFRDWQKRSSSFAAMAAFNVTGGDLLGRNTPENVAGALVTTDFFNVLGIQPLIGRGFDSKDENQSVIILSYSLWKRDFAGSKSVVDQTLTLGEKPYTIIGVMPSGFIHPEPQWDRTAEFWRPMPDYSKLPRGFRFLRVVARLKHGTSFDAAAAEMRNLSAQLAREFPSDEDGRTVLMVPLREQMFGDMYRPMFLLLFAAVAVLLVAWVNVTNLQLARTNSRLSDILIRLALGARLRQIIFLIFGESILLATAGTALGLLLGYVALHALQVVAPSGLNGLELIAVDARLFLFAGLLAVVLAFLIGVPPVIRVLRLRETAGPQGALYHGMKPTTRRGRSVVVAAQLAIAMPLLVASTLLARSFVNLVSVDPGFNGDRLLTLRINLPQARYPGAEAAREFFKDFSANARTIPGVQDVALTSSIPLTKGNAEVSTGISLQEGTPAKEMNTAFYHVISENYFQVMGIGLLSGRPFNASDQASQPRVAIINSTFAHNYFHGQDPLGKTLFLSQGATPVAVSIVGVASDIRSQTLASPPAPEIYTPFAQDTSLSMGAVLRTAIAPESVIGPLRAKVAQLDEQLALRDVQPMSHIAYVQTSRSRFATLLVTLLCFLALALALVGVSSVVAYIITERKKEFGIRMAFGASRSDIVRTVVIRVLKFATAGIAIGIGLAFGATRIPANLIYGVNTEDPVTFVGCALALITAVLAACYFSTRGVHRIDATTLLRMER